MNEQPYSKREIDQKFDSLTSRLLDENEGILPRIEAQTLKTNGRVRWAEKMIWLSIGGLGVLAVTVIPVLTWALLQIVNLPSELHVQVQAAVQDALR